MSEDDVKALADSYKGLLVKIQYHNDEGIISVTGVLTEESREALARVALEFCEKRRKKTTHTVTKVTAGFFPGGAEGILEESWEEEVDPK